MLLRPRLMAITDCARLTGDPLVARVETLCRASLPGTVMVQLRDRELPVRERMALAERLLSITRRTQQALCINDRIDLYLLVRADALHLGERSVEPSEARRLVGEQAFISAASHDPEQAAIEAVNAVVLSPILDERKGKPALGLAGLERARSVLAQSESAPLLFALGGIDALGAQRCLVAGADGVAAIGAVFGAEDPEPLLKTLGICRA